LAIKISFVSQKFLSVYQIFCNRNILVYIFVYWYPSNVRPQPV